MEELFVTGENRKKGRQATTTVNTSIQYGKADVTDVIECSMRQTVVEIHDRQHLKRYGIVEFNVPLDTV